MTVYLLTFLFVMFFVFVAYIFKGKSPFLSYFFSLVCILILSYIAGFRAYSVGTDVNVYGLTYFNQSGIFSTLYQFLDFHWFKEPLYFTMNYIIYNTFHSMQAFLFIHQLFISIIVFYIAYHDSKKGSFIFYIFTYLMIWYNTSFNIIRQSLALFIVLYSFNFLEKNKNVQYIIAVLIASCFHQSVLLCLLFPLIKVISKKDYNYRKLIVISLSLFLFFIFGKFFATKLITIFPMFEKYFGYMLRDESNFILKYGVFKLIFMIIILLFSFKIKEEKLENIRFFIYFVVLDTIFYFSSMFIMYGYRMSYLFLPYYIYFIPRLVKYYSNKKSNCFFKVTMIVCLCFYWYIRYVNIGYDGTIPYAFFNK